MVIGDPSTASAIPEAYALERKIGATYYGGLPNKLAPTEDMVLAPPLLPLRFLSCSALSID